MHKMLPVVAKIFTVMMIPLRLNNSGLQGCFVADSRKS